MAEISHITSQACERWTNLLVGNIGEQINQYLHRLFELALESSKQSGKLSETDIYALFQSYCVGVSDISYTELFQLSKILEKKIANLHKTIHDVLKLNFAVMSIVRVNDINKIRIPQIEKLEFLKTCYTVCALEIGCKSPKWFSRNVAPGKRQSYFNYIKQSIHQQLMNVILSFIPLATITLVSPKKKKKAPVEDLEDPAFDKVVNKHSDRMKTKLNPGIPVSRRSSIESVQMETVKSSERSSLKEIKSEEKHVHNIPTKPRLSVSKSSIVSKKIESAVPLTRHSEGIRKNEIISTNIDPRLSRTKSSLSRKSVKKETEVTMPISVKEPDPVSASAPIPSVVSAAMQSIPIDPSKKVLELSPDLGTRESSMQQILIDSMKDAKILIDSSRVNQSLEDLSDDSFEDEDDRALDEYISNKSKIMS